MKKTHIIGLIPFLLLFYNCKETATHENSLTIKIKLVNDSIYVSYNFPALIDYKAEFIFPETLEGTREVIKMSSIFDFRFIYTDTILNFNRKDSIRSVGKLLDKLTYTVKLDSTSKNTSYLFNTFKTNDLLIINPASFCGYIKEYKNFKHIVYISGINDYLSDNIKEDVMTFHFSNYDSFVNNPFYYSKNFDKIDTLINDTKITLNVKSNFKTVPIANILQITAPVIRIALDELKNIGITLPQYTINIIFNEIVDATKSAVALEKRNQTLIVYYGEPFFYNEKDSADFVFGLQNTLLHEMLHLFMPFSFRDKILEPFDYNNLKMSGHLWLYEGFITYQTLKFLVANGLITKQKFIDEIERMIGAYKGYERGGWSVPLYRSSIEAFEKPYLHHFFYNRSSILCFYADLSIMEKSNGTKTFWDILSGIYKTTPVFHPDSLNNYLIQHTFPEFRDFIHTYIIGAKYLDLKLFNQFGLNYVEINFAPTEKYIPINISSFKNGILNVIVREIGMPPSSTDKIISLTRINDLPISTYSINSIFRRAIPVDTISVEILQNGEKKLELIELFSARNISFYPNIVVSDSAFWDKYLSFTTSIE